MNEVKTTEVNLKAEVINVATKTLVATGTYAAKGIEFTVKNTPKAIVFTGKALGTTTKGLCWGLKQFVTGFKEGMK